MVRRVGFGEDKPREQRKAKPRPAAPRPTARKVEKFHLEGAHEAPAAPAPRRSARPAPKPKSAKRFWIFFVIAVWGLPMVVGMIFSLTNFLIYQVNIVPLTFLWVFLLGYGIFRIFRYLNRKLGFLPKRPDVQ